MFKYTLPRLLSGVQSDVMAALGETGSPTAKQARTKPKQTALTSTIGKRFEELDWDHSGLCQAVFVLIACHEGSCQHQPFNTPCKSDQ